MDRNATNLRKDINGSYDQKTVKITQIKNSRYKKEEILNTKNALQYFLVIIKTNDVANIINPKI